MRVTALAISATLAVVAQAAIPVEYLSSGRLDVWKNNIGTGERIPLTFDASGALVAAGTTGQTLQWVNAAENSTIIFPGSSEVVVTKGTIGSHLGETCLTRDSATGALALKDCVAGKDVDQRWQFSLVYHENDKATGSDREIVPFQKGTYTHFTGGKLYQSNTKPVSKWFLTFSYIE